MQTLKKVIVNILIALLIAAACVIVTWYLPGDYNHDLAALVNKRDALQSTPAPRLIFIGGSNLITLHSAVLEQQLRKMTGVPYSVVNLGLWGGLSMERYLDEIKSSLQPGDIVILCQEYATLLDTKYFTYIRTNNEAKKYFFLVSRERHCSRLLSPRAVREGLSDIIELNQMKIKTYLHVLIDADFTHHFTGGYYRYRKEYNRQGDRILPFRVIRPLISAGALFQSPVEKNIGYLSQFNHYARSQHMMVLITFPPFPAGEYWINRIPVTRLSDKFREMGLETIGRPEDTVFPESLFADTVYHLTPQGEAARTRLLIEHLCKTLGRHRLKSDFHAIP
jgi:hypothetical protein